MAAIEKFLPGRRPLQDPHQERRKKACKEIIHLERTLGQEASERPSETRGTSSQDWKDQLKLPPPDTRYRTEALVRNVGVQGQGLE